jgi:hypothetical protein
LLFMLVRLSHASSFSPMVSGPAPMRARVPSGETRSLIGEWSAFAEDIVGWEESF